MKGHVFHPEAAEEYVSAVEFYRGIDPDLGARFYEEMERVILEIRRSPEWFGNSSRRLTGTSALIFLTR